MSVIQIIKSILLATLGIGFFLYSINTFSKTLEKSLKPTIKPLFKKVGDNRFKSFSLGIIATTLMQSSTATTVITVSLASAGIITLFQSSAIIIGANVGSSLTSLLIPLAKFEIKYIFISLLFIGLVFKIAFCNSNRKKFLIVANLFIGIGGIFLGLALLNSAFSNSAELQNFFSNLFVIVTNPILLVLLGAVFTAIVQSSGASVAVYISLLVSGVLPLQSAIFLVLGSEIGTCITSLLSSVKQSYLAKSAAAFHLSFNTFSAIIFTALFWGLGFLILPFFTTLISNPIWQISIFQVLYNIVGAVLFLPLIRPINKINKFAIQKIFAKKSEV